MSSDFNSGRAAIILSLVVTICSCVQPKVKVVMPPKIIARGISQVDWGMTDGKPVYLYSLVNRSGMTVKISSYGATITSWTIDASGDSNKNVVLGFDSLTGYLAKPPYFGATVGRYGNRIARGKFSLDGKAFQLPLNDGKNTLHGGIKGFDKQVWTASAVTDSMPSLTLHYVSRDGEEGFPGNLSVSVQFKLDDDGTLHLLYDASTDQPTPVNLTNHSYFNLGGNAAHNILDDQLMIFAAKYTPVDSTLIPTGELKPVFGTPFDFMHATRIGARITEVKGGYDHNWVLNRNSAQLQTVAVLTDAVAGRKLTVSTTEPGLQFYTGNFLDGTLVNRDGKHIGKHAALCLETQHFPDSPNEPGFPSSIVRPGHPYHSETTYRLSVEK